MFKSKKSQSTMAEYDADLENQVYKAKLAEQAERYNEMVDENAKQPSLGLKRSSLGPNMIGFDGDEVRRSAYRQSFHPERHVTGKKGTDEKAYNCLLLKADCVDIGSSIEIPVGLETLDRILNNVGRKSL